MRKRDENGRFVRVNPTREEYEAKIAKLEKEVDNLATKCQEAKNEGAFWRQEYDRAMHLYRMQEQQLKSTITMRNWLYKRSSIFTKLKYKNMKQAGIL